MAITIGNREARRLALYVHGLSRPVGSKIDADGLHEIIQGLGYVQVDSINTFARAHDQILFSRNQTYRPALLKELLERDRRLFEHWTHDAAIIPLSWYPHWHHRFRLYRERLPQSRWLTKRTGSDFSAVVTEVRRRVRNEGPLLARHFESPDGHRPGGWWHWAPAKTALEYLWRTGELAIAGRENFQKVYDLADRVIPSHVREVRTRPGDYVDWACSTAIKRLGFATPRQIAAFWKAVSLDEVNVWCDRNLGADVVRAEVEDVEGRMHPVLARGDIATILTGVSAPPRRVRAISPFDPLIRDRDRLRRFFGFDYRIEVFVPAAKRRYGYYVLPLLEGDRFVGRTELKARRSEGVLAVKGVWMEDGARLYGTRADRFESELERLRRFVGLEVVDYPRGAIKSPGSA